jgi:squalene cyclase
VEQEQDGSWLVRWLVSELEVCCGSVVVSCRCEKLVGEAGDSSGNVRRWKALPSNS